MFKSIISLFLAVALFGCNDDQLDVVIPTTENYNFNMKLPTDGSAGESTETIADVNSYAVNNNFFIKSFKDIILNENGDFTIDVPQNTQLYFTSNIVEPTSLANLAVETTPLANLLAVTTNTDMEHTANGAPNFFSGSYIPTTNPVAEAERKSIAMMRSTARLDFDMSADEKILVTKIVIANASKITSVFKQVTTFESTDKVTYTKAYDPALKGKQLDQFRLYESTTPVTVTISATYYGVPMQTTVNIPTVERNKAYNILIKSTGTTIEGTFVILPWEIGDNIEALPIQPVK